MRALILALAVAGWFGPAAAETPAPGSVAYFGVQFVDMSTEGDENGIRADETARTAMATDYVADDLEARGFRLVSTDPVADRLATVKNPARCNGCEVAMARDLGADYAVVGEVRKTSNLILSVALVLRDARSGEALRGGMVDIRSNTDESWQRGLRYILRNMIFSDR